MLDMENDRAVMFNQPVKLDFTSSGHYCVNIMDRKDKTIQDDDQVLSVVGVEDTLNEQRFSENMNKVEKQKMLVKLHRQLGHASSDRLVRLLASSGSKDPECAFLLQKIISECETCQRYSRTTPKPAVGLPLASQHNETVAVDLHELEPGVWYLHSIEQFTRFSAGSILTTKRGTEIVRHFIHDWVSVH